MNCDRPIGVLCDTHAIPVLMFLAEHGPSTKTGVYWAVGRSAGMPAKLDRLRDAGLLTLESAPGSVSTVVGLTELGESVASALERIDSLMAGDHRDH